MNRAPSPAVETIVKAACPHDCPDTCALEVHVRDGVAVKVAGAAAHGPTAGVLCTRYTPYQPPAMMMRTIMQCRGVAARYDKFAADDLALVKLASIRTWPPANEYTP